MHKLRVRKWQTAKCTTSSTYTHTHTSPVVIKAVDNQVVNTDGLLEITKDEEKNFTVYGDFEPNTEVYATESADAKRSKAWRGRTFVPYNVTTNRRVCAEHRNV